MSALAHGGALRAAMRAWPDAPTPWIDLSTGLNPIPYPVGDLPHEAWTRLPEPDDIADLEASAAAAYRASAAADVVAAPGAQSLIQSLPRLFAAKRVAVLGPTYEEHAARWDASGARVRVIESLADAGSADTIVVVNPNNPDGRLLPTRTLARLAASVARRGGRLVVDESFSDALSSDASYAPFIAEPNAIVLRSFGKTFGLGGVRLGFAIAARADAAIIRDALGPWAVSGPAITIGRTALRDDLWLVAARERLANDAARLDVVLEQAGLLIAGGTPLFRLALHEQANAIHERLCENGILTRQFTARRDWLRFGIPGCDEHWGRLVEALRSQPSAR